MTAPVIQAGDDLALTVPDLLARQVAARGDAVLLAGDDERLTYAGADERSARLARSLLALGAGPGTRIAILRPNDPGFVVAWLAAARIGAVAVPLSTFSTSLELVDLLRRADVHVLLATSAYRSNGYVAALRSAIPELEQAGPGPLWSVTVPSLRHVVIDDGLADRADEVDPAVLTALEGSVTLADPMVIVHTSGSTSEPKGVIHTHGALIRHLDNLNQLRRYEAGDVLFTSSPFFWIGGFAYALLGTLVAGATLVCSTSADAGAVLDLIERERPNLVNGFAASVAHLPDDPSFAARDLSSIERGNLWPIMPAAVVPKDVELRHSMLGMTEAGSVCLTSADETDQPEARRGSFGQAVPGFETSVRADDDGHECAPGEVGTLWFRGPFLMEGYDGRERHETFDGDGWYDTGDLVTVDAEGFFYFRGRGSDLIKTAGANVSPREVEAALLDATGLVAHVVGVDDPVKGQVVAALVRAPADGSAVDVDALRTALRDRLSAYKVPKRIVVVPAGEVPVMSSGKLDLRAIKERLLARDHHSGLWQTRARTRRGGADG